MSTESLETTRRSLHAVAELLLAGPQHAATDEIALRAVDGGFVTRFGEEIRVDVDHVVRGRRRVPIDGRTPAELAVELGTTVNALSEVYSDGPDRDPEQRLSVDADAARRLVDALAAGDQALRDFAPDEDPILWPEHFDVGISVGEVNYGVSPGDGHEPVPYAYVGPWDPPANDDFWNAPFGAALRLEAGAGSAEIHAFFVLGRDRRG